ncbi:DUF6624 domain-containing protein [Flavobacterium terrigena]|uniref:Tetratricopeptide repeat-containing protein n=1 Tax=Flavobacterium terrigena TaxID=402734 RepID=A0A1H6URK5_9FLAO|nr:DUF6624 domain-containing protein [Flavobacterium terrigena]SEI94336.1 hypothetical protein SAMN05660918_1996 [Flavobacterium terrigena]
MKKTFFITLLILISSSNTFGQDFKKYNELVNEAMSFYDSKDYHKAGEKFSEAFEVNDKKASVNARYNAACSWALANEKDLAFVQLFNIVEKGNYTNIDHITKDTDLISLYKDKRWKKVIKKVKDNKEKAEAKLDKKLVAKLDTIYQEDQDYRMQIKGLEEKYGRESNELKAHWKVIAKQDSINLIKITKILDERGWLGQDVIGSQGNSTLFLVIQHADIKTQEKYLPMMKEAVKKGNANSSSLALLEDRVALRKGEKQIYGSQIGRDKETGEFYILPLADPENVDKRRAEVGLGTIQEYVALWKITWNVEEYKLKLPEYEAKQKK